MINYASFYSFRQYFSETLNVESANEHEIFIRDVKVKEQEILYFCVFYEKSFEFLKIHYVSVYLQKLIVFLVLTIKLSRRLKRSVRKLSINW